MIKKIIEMIDGNQKMFAEWKMGYRNFGLYVFLGYFFDSIIPTKTIKYIRLLGFIRNDWGERILDVGCGKGYFLSYIKEYGKEVWGVDVDCESVKEARKNVENVFCGEVDIMPDEYFDVVILSHTIEHLKNPIEELKRIKKKMRKGGKLVIITPNKNSLLSKIFGKYWFPYHIPDHIHFFSPEDLSDVCKKSGFKNIKIFTSSYPAEWIFLKSKEIYKVSLPYIIGSYRKNFEESYCLVRRKV